MLCNFFVCVCFHRSHQFLVARSFLQSASLWWKGSPGCDSENFMVINAEPPAAGGRWSHRRDARREFAASCTLVTSRLTLWRCRLSHAARSANEASLRAGSGSRHQGLLMSTWRATLSTTTWLMRALYVGAAIASKLELQDRGTVTCFPKAIARNWMFEWKTSTCSGHLKFLEPSLQCSGAFVTLIFLKDPWFLRWL